MGTYDGVSYAPFEYPTGWLAYDCDENSTHVCVSEFQGMSLKGPQLHLYSADWALSSYGGLLAYEPRDTSSWWVNRLHVDVVSIDSGWRATVFDERGIRGHLRCISWSPDSSRITFKKEWSRSGSRRGTNEAYHTVGVDGTGLAQSDDPESWADCRRRVAESPDGQWTAVVERRRGLFGPTKYTVRISGPGNRVTGIEAPLLNFNHGKQIEWSGDLPTTSPIYPTGTPTPVPIATPTPTPTRTPTPVPIATPTPTLTRGKPGTLLWRFPANVTTVTPLVVDGVVYFGSRDDGEHMNQEHVNAVDAKTGELRWRFQTADYVYGTPAVVDGVVYVGSEDNYFYALDASTGNLIWRYHQGDGEESSPVVSNEIVYVRPGLWLPVRVGCFNGTTALGRRDGRWFWRAPSGSRRIGIRSLWKWLARVRRYDWKVVLALRNRRLDARTGDRWRSCIRGL